MIPYVATEECFALKGGTAINFFIRDMPRLSVDIDLTYLPIEAHEVTLKNISAALVRIAEKIRKAGFEVQEGQSAGKRVHKLFASDGKGRITIEPNEVIRGTVGGTEMRDVSATVETLFETSASIQTISLADLYGGKLCAALDRQHPRDLFDVKELLANEGLTDEIRRAFVVYLAGHDRPIHEVIDPNLKDIREAFDREFAGMTTEPVQLEELVETRSTLIKRLKSELTKDERQFLVSIKEGAPNWALIPIPGIDNLPALQWKQLNIPKMDKKKHDLYLKKLREKLEI